MRLVASVFLKTTGVALELFTEPLHQVGIRSNIANDVAPKFGCLFYTICVATLVSTVWAISLYEIKHITDDEMNVALWTFANARDLADRQGRLANIVSYPLYKTPYISNSLLFLLLFRVAGLIAATAAVGYFCAVLFSNPWVGVTAFALTNLCWANSLGGHNLAAAYPFSVLAIYAINIVAITAILQGFRRAATATVAVGASLALGSLLLGGDYIIQFVPCYMLLYFAYFRQSHLRFRDHVAPLVGAILLGVAANLLFRITHPSSYDGNTQLNVDPARIARTWWTLTTGLFPMWQPYRNRHEIFDDTYAATLAMMTAALAGLIVFTMRKRLIGISQQHSSIDNVVRLGCIAALICTPNALLCLTTKYQTWVIDYGVTDFTYSSLSFFGLMMGLVYLTVLCSCSVRLYFAVVCLWTLCIFSTVANNLYVGSVLRTASHKWTLFEAALRKIPADAHDSPPQVGLSEAFFDGLNPSAALGYWTTYARKRCGRSITAVEAPSGGTDLILFSSKRSGQQCLVARDSKVSHILACGSTMPQINESYLCVARAHTDFGNLLYPGSGSGVENIPIATMQREFISVSAGWPAYCYTPQNTLLQHACLGIVSAIARDRLDRITFGSGIYGLEYSPDGKAFRWCQSRAEFTLHALRTGRAALRVVASSPTAQTLSISVGEQSHNVALLPFETAEIRHAVDITHEALTVTMASDTESVQLNPADPRTFSFAIHGIYLCLPGEVTIDRDSPCE